MSEKLSHLSKHEVSELIERYYGREKVANLIKDYKLELRPSQLVKHLPPEVLDQKCIYCEVNLIRPRLSRDYQSWKLVPGFCSNCSHEESGFCSCKNCKAVEWYHQDKERQEKQDFLDTWVNHEDSEKIELDDLTLTEKIYLGALLREGISEDYNYIKTVSSYISHYKAL